MRVCGPTDCALLAGPIFFQGDHSSTSAVTAAARPVVLPQAGVDGSAYCGVSHVVSHV